jgi:hypothetical protein
VVRLGETFGVQPRVADGIRGEALVVSSVCGPDVRRSSANDRISSGYQRRWEARIPVLVRLPGRDPYWLAPRRWMTRAKFPVAGTSLPVTVDPQDRSSVRFEWDEVPDIDDWITAGHPVFTDPDVVLGQLRSALAEYRNAAQEDAVGRALGGFASAGSTEAGLVGQAIAEARQSVAPPPTEAPAVEGPSARVLAVTPGTTQGMNTKWRGEMLLSVAPPGGGRHGLRWKGKIDGTRFVREWGDIPVAIDSAGDVEIRWDAIPTTLGVVADKARSRNDQIEAELAAATKWESPGAAAPPAAAPPAPAPAPAAPAPDPMDELKRLAELRDAGALTDSEFAAEKARVLDQL